MNLSPGGQATVTFSTNQEGDLIGTGSVSATVLRNGVITSVVTTITSIVTGHYAVNFTVPTNWVEYDRVDVTFDLEWAPGRITGCTKPVGVVTIAPQTSEFIADLLVADQVKTVVGGVTTITYYQAGTNQTVVLHEQVQTGDPCEGDVSLIATP